jgi:hypothetical protein
MKAQKPFCAARYRTLFRTRFALALPLRLHPVGRLLSALVVPFRFRTMSRGAMPTSPSLDGRCSEQRMNEETVPCTTVVGAMEVPSAPPNLLKRCHCLRQPPFLWKRLFPGDVLEWSNFPSREPVLDQGQQARQPSPSPPNPPFTNHGGSAFIKTDFAAQSHGYCPRVPYPTATLGSVVPPQIGRNGVRGMSCGSLATHFEAYNMFPTAEKKDLSIATGYWDGAQGSLTDTTTIPAELAMRSSTDPNGGPGLAEMAAVTGGDSPLPTLLSVSDASRNPPYVSQLCTPICLNEGYDTGAARYPPPPPPANINISASLHPTPALPSPKLGKASTSQSPATCTSPAHDREPSPESPICSKYNQGQGVSPHDMASVASRQTSASSCEGPNCTQVSDQIHKLR